MHEEWKPLSLDDRYEVSNLGRVRSWAVNGSHDTRARSAAPVVMVIKNCNRYGYPQVTIAGKKFTIHFLVSNAWEIRGDGPLIRHLDGDPKNNSTSNLCRGTQSENMQDAYKQGRLPHLRRRRCTGD